MDANANGKCQFLNLWTRIVQMVNIFVKSTVKCILYNLQDATNTIKIALMAQVDNVYSWKHH